MGRKKAAEQLVREIIERDDRYAFEAYRFVLEALDYTYRMLGEKRHVTGAELLEGARRCAIERWGPMARAVLDHWGIRRCEDIGEVVFNLVGSGLLSKTEKVSMEDLRGGYGFGEAFDRIFDD